MKFPLFVLLLLTAPAFAQVPNPPPVPVFPSRVATFQDLQEAANVAHSLLSAPLLSTATSIPVYSGASFPAPTAVSIDSEVIHICSVTAISLAVCSGGRGAEGTAASTHNAGADVQQRETALFHNQLAEETMAVETRAMYIIYPTDARFAGGAKCDGVTDDYLPLLAAINYATAIGGAEILLPPTGHLCATSHSLDLLGLGIGVFLRGQGPSNNSGLLALSGGAFSTYVDQYTGLTHTYLISIGGPTATVAVSYAQVTDMQLNGNGGVVDTVAYSQTAEENCTFSRLFIGGGKFAGLHLQSYGIQNSKYQDLTIYAQTGAVGVMIFSVISRVELSDVTVNGGEALSTGSVVVNQGGTSMALRNIHCEHGSHCLTLNGVGYILTENIQAGPDQHDVIYFQSGQGLVAININGSGGVLGITDCVARGCASSGNELLYASSANGALSVPGDPSIPTVIPYANSVPAPANASWGGPSLNVTSTISSYTQTGTEYTTQDQSGSAGSVHWIGTNNNGVMLQNYQVLHTFAGGGLHTYGNGPGTDPTFGGIGAGESTDGGTFTARGTAASGINFGSGTGRLYAQTGLAPGTNFSPVAALQWNSTGITSILTGGMPGITSPTCTGWTNGLCTKP